MRTSRALSRHKTRARCRVQKLPRVSCYKIFPLASPPSQKGPGGALCGVLASRNIVLPPVCWNAPQGAEIGALWGLCPAELHYLCHAPPPRKPAAPPGQRPVPSSADLHTRVFLAGKFLAEQCRTVVYCPRCPSPIWQQKGGVRRGISLQFPCGRRSECSRLLHPQVA